MRQYNLENMREHWDKFAENYIAAREGSEVDDRIIEMLKSNPSGKILEIGFGPALVAKKFLDEVPDADYVGLDISKIFCYSARNKLGKATNLLVSDIKKPGLKRGRFDTILEMAAIHHFRRMAIPEVVKTIASLLKPGGRFILAEDWGLTPENEREALALKLRRRKAVLQENREYHPSDNEWLKMLRDAGLELVRYFHAPRPLNLDFFEESADINYMADLSQLRSLWQGETPFTKMTTIESMKP